MNLKQNILLITVCLTSILTMQNASAYMNSEDISLGLSGASNKVFVDTSPIISADITNSRDVGKNYSLEYTVTNRDGDAAEKNNINFRIPAKTTAAKQINTASGFGAYEIDVKVSDGESAVTKKQYCAVVPEIGQKNDFLGLCTHFSAGTRENSNDAFPQIDKSGAGWIRDDLLWKECEYEKGQYKIPDRFMEMLDYAQSHNIKVLAILNSGNDLYDNGQFPTSDEGIKAYAEFCKYVANRLKGKADAFEIWNEPEIFNKEATPAQYTKLLKSAYGAIKSSDGNPDATVVGGALTAMKSVYGAEDFLKGMLSAGAHHYMDAFSFHPYVHGRYYPDEYAGKSVFDNIDTVEKWLNQAGAADLPIWLTEVGYYDNDGTAYRTEEDQAAALARMGSYLKHSSRIGRVFIYNYKEKGTDVAEPEDKFGIVSYYYYPKPAYVSLTFANKLLAEAEPVKNETTAFGAAYSFTNKYKEDIFSIWALRGNIQSTESADKTTTLKITEGGASSEITAGNDCFEIKIPEGRELILYDMYGNIIAEKITSGSYTVTYKPMYAVVRAKTGVTASDDGGVRVSGYAKPDSFVTVSVRDGKSAFGKCAYISQTVTDSEGRFSFEFNLEPENVYVMSVYNGIVSKERLNLNGYDMACYIYDNDGNELTDSASLFAADSITIKVDAASLEENPVLYAAVYSGDGKITAVSETALSEDSTELEIEGISGAEVLKIMLWNNDLKPLCKNIRIK